MSNVTKMPNTKTIELGNLTLQCRLDGKAIFNVERRLSESLLTVIGSQEKLPPVHKLLMILHESNTTHGIKEDQVVKSFYSYVDNGGTTMELYEKVMELLEKDGFFGKNTDEEADEEEEEEEEVLTLDNLPEEE